MSFSPDVNTNKNWMPLVLGIVIGLVVGGGVASGIFGYILHQRDLRYAEAIAGKTISGAGGILQSALGGNGQQKNTPEEEKLIAIGNGFVTDLKELRLTKVYRSTTPGYQAKVDREKFDEMINAIQGLTGLRDYPDCSVKFRTKSPESGKETTSASASVCEFYCTARTSDYRKRFNFVLDLVEVKGEWLIDELEITPQER